MTDANTTITMNSSLLNFLNDEDVDFLLSLETDSGSVEERVAALFSTQESHVTPQRSPNTSERERNLAPLMSFCGEEPLSTDFPYSPKARDSPDQSLEPLIGELPTISSTGRTEAWLNHLEPESARIPLVDSVDHDGKGKCLCLKHANVLPSCQYRHVKTCVTTFSEVPKLEVEVSETFPDESHLQEPDMSTKRTVSTNVTASWGKLIGTFQVIN